MTEIKGFLRALAAINMKLKLEEKIMEHKFKVGDLVIRKTGIELWTVCDIQDDGEQIVCQSTFDGRKHAFFWKGLKLAPEIPTASKFKVDYIVQLPRGAGKSVKLEEIRKSMESSIGYPGVSYFPNMEHTYVPNEDDLKYIKDDMELTKKMAERIHSKTTHRDITKELLKTYQKKNKDYGDSFANSLDKRGLIAAIVRMEDKMSRLYNLVGADELMVTSESMRDTVMDLSNYCIMTAMWMDNNSDARMVVFERGEL